MKDIAYLKDVHYISLYVLMGLAALLLIYICILIWMRRRYSLFLIAPLIFLIWYAFGFGWRLGFFSYLGYISNFIGGSAKNHIAQEADIPTDIWQLLSDDNLAKEITKPFWLNKIPEMIFVSNEKDDEINLQIYWIGFDEDNDEIKNKEFPGWFRLLYFPWFYDGDILVYECFYKKMEIELYSTIQEEYRTIKYLLLLNDIIAAKKSEIAKRIGANQQSLRGIQSLYLSTRKAYSETFGKYLNEQEIDESLDYIKNAEYIYLPRNRLIDLQRLLKEQ